MSYEVFMMKVNALIKKAGGRIKVRFSNDEESGRHYANCSDGTVIVGSRSSIKVSVRWNGGNHQGIAEI